MPKQITSFSLSSNTINQISKVAKALGVSRSVLIEILVEQMGTILNDADNISELQGKIRDKLRKHLKE